MKLVGFELRKILLRRGLLLALVLCTLVNGVKIAQLCRDKTFSGSSHSWGPVYWSLYDQYAGEMTLDKINALLEVYRPLEAQTADHTATTATDVPGTMTGNLYEDKHLLEWYFVDPMEYLYTYQNLAAQVEQRARENADFYTRTGGQWEAEKNQCIAQLYAGRHITQFAYTEGFQLLFTYDFSTLLAVLLALYAISQVFSREKECAMDQLIITNPRGGAATTLAKVVASGVVLAAIALWFSLWDTAGFALGAKLWDGWNLPIYALSDFAAASVSLPMWGYALAVAGLRMAGLWAMGMLFLLVGLFTRHALIPFVAGGGVFVALSLVGALWSGAQRGWIKAVNPYYLLTGRDLMGRTEFVSLLGRPVLTWQAALLGALAVGGVAIALIFRLRGTSQLRRGGALWAR